MNNFFITIIFKGFAVLSSIIVLKILSRKFLLPYYTKYKQLYYDKYRQYKKTFVEITAFIGGLILVSKNLPFRGIFNILAFGTGIVAIIAVITVSFKTFIKFLLSTSIKITDNSKRNFINADLSDTNLKGADLSEANLSNANLKGADLSEANLSNANLKGADLSKANLRGANLNSANLNEALVERTQFGSNMGISDSLKQDLINRGAIFQDLLSDHSEF